MKLGQNFVIYFVRYSDNGVSRENAFEIYWPLRIEISYRDFQLVLKLTRWSQIFCAFQRFDLTQFLKLSSPFSVPLHCQHCQHYQQLIGCSVFESSSVLLAFLAGSQQICLVWALIKAANSNSSNFDKNYLSFYVKRQQFDSDLSSLLAVKAFLSGFEKPKFCPGLNYLDNLAGLLAVPNKIWCVRHWQNLMNLGVRLWKNLSWHRQSRNLILGREKFSGDFLHVWNDW